ncbi:hypothetical protein J6590_054472 [Homalodisca vitripennis]|nr:hypothetical protein J6590_054472 [Homalodisca vitripennis]
MLGLDPARRNRLMQRPQGLPPKALRFRCHFLVRQSPAVNSNLLSFVLREYSALYPLHYVTLHLFGVSKCWKQTRYCIKGLMTKRSNS